MNGERTFGKPIPNEKLSELMNTVFNVWFKKWKRVSMTDASFDEAFDEVCEIMKQYDEYPVASHLCISLLYELDARMFGGYTETTKDKVLQLIKSEGKTA